MITPHQAERLDHLLRGQGRSWTPAPGDRFVVPGRDLDDQVFVVSEMTIDGTGTLRLDLPPYGLVLLELEPI